MLLCLMSVQNVGYVFGSSTRGQRSLYEMGLTGIPITNCNNNCSTGSTALFQSRCLVAGGLARCTLALGFEKMQVNKLAHSISQPMYVLGYSTVAIAIRVNPFQ